MLSYYQQVLDELREKTSKDASEYITNLYLILREEEQCSPEECRAKIESDCSDIWSKDTIRKYLPPEAKNPMKRNAGKISAEIKKKKVKENKEINEIQPMIVNSSVDGDGSKQLSALVDGRSDEENPVEMNPTENSSVGQKRPESMTFPENMDSQFTYNVVSYDNYDCYIPAVADRLEDERRELLEDIQLADVCINKYPNKGLLLPCRLAEQICSDVSKSKASGSENTPDFELEHDGISIISVRKYHDDGSEEPLGGNLD